MQAGSSWSLARRILALQAVVLVIVLGAALAALLVDTDAETERTTGDRVVAVASTVAAAPSVRAAVTATYPAGQEITGPVRGACRATPRTSGHSTGADFVVVMTPDGIRYTHPDPTQIGQEYRGSRDAALAGGHRASRPTPAPSDRPCGRSSPVLDERRGRRAGRGRRDWSITSTRRPIAGCGCSGFIAPARWRSASSGRC